MPYESESRREAIVRRATTTGLASVDDLAREFDVTASTIRRDLGHLERAGRVARTYGGARALVAHPEASLRQRLGESFEAKRGIAIWAASQVCTGETILLDSGTTTGALAHELRHAGPLTVVTTGMTALSELATGSCLRVECLGGTLRPLSEGFVGPLTETALERRTFDRVFLGADGITADDGICEAEGEQTKLKELMATRGNHIYVLVHGAKIGSRPFHSWAPLSRHWTLVTDDTVEPARLQPFHAKGVTVVTVDSEGRSMSDVKP